MIGKKPSCHCQKNFSRRPVSLIPFFHHRLPCPTYPSYPIFPVLASAVLVHRWCLLFHTVFILFYYQNCRCKLLYETELEPFRSCLSVPPVSPFLPQKKKHTGGTKGKDSSCLSCQTGLLVFMSWHSEMIYLFSQKKVPNKDH